MTGSGTFAPNVRRSSFSARTETLIASADAPAFRASTALDAESKMKSHASEGIAALPTVGIIRNNAIANKPSLEVLIGPAVSSIAVSQRPPSREGKVGHRLHGAKSESPSAC